MIPADSFYARLAQWRDVLVDDADYAPLYKDSPRGRPSIPPSMVVLAMLLEYHDDCSDAEAEQKMRFDLRWKHALGLGLEEAGFDATVLCRFRHKLLERDLERNLFERLVKAARGAGLITKDAAQLLDRLPHPGGRWGEGHLHTHPRRHQQEASALCRIRLHEQSRASGAALVVHRPCRPREARDRLG